MPALLLVKAVDRTHLDPEKDRRGCYKRGMVVEVRKDGVAFGRKEGLPKFVEIRVTDATVDDLVDLARPWTNEKDSTDARAIKWERADGKTFRRRFILPDALIVAAEMNGGRASTTLATITGRGVVDRLNPNDDAVRIR